MYTTSLPRSTPDYPSHPALFWIDQEVRGPITAPVAKRRPDAAIIQAFLIKAAMAGGSPRVAKTRKTRARKVCH